MLQISEETLRKVIKRCPHLRALIIPNFVTDKVMEDVKNLRNLELLDITGNSNLTEEGLRYLSSESLQVLIIDSNRTYDVLVELLPRLPNLKEIRSYQYTGRAFLELKTPFVSKLRVISDSGTNSEQMKAIVSVCPNLKKLYMEDPENDAFEFLNELRELKQLKISRFSSSSVKFKIKKLTLQSLDLKNVAFNINDVCLTLEDFSLRSCDIYFKASDALCFRNLKVIELIDCDAKKEMVMEFLKYSNQLRRLAISNDIGLTDLDIRTLCQNQHLRQLEELWLSLAKQLTSDSVILLMNHCDKLSLLGTLNGWNIEKIEVNYLRCVVYFTNTNLNLLYFSCF